MNGPRLIPFSVFLRLQRAMELHNESEIGGCLALEGLNWVCRAVVAIWLLYFPLRKHDRLQFCQLYLNKAEKGKKEET